MRLEDIPGLLLWFRRSGVEYPWGEGSGFSGERPDSYLVWVSEIMLQQTQVKAVIPYFLHWREAYPDLKTLAEAELEQVIRSWEGLGYYSRARNIHKCAKEIIARGDKALPRTRDQLIRLPGIGPYTAAAVLSIAHGESIPVMDANVKRICQRLGEHDEWSPSLEREWESRIKKRMVQSGSDAGEFNCALMQLGQLVCKKSQPKCEKCPLSESCQARKSGRAGEIPPVKKKSLNKWDSHVLIYQKKDRIFLEYRDKGIGKGLWSLPRIPREEKLPVGWVVEKRLKTRPHHFTTNRESLYPVVLSEVLGAEKPRGKFSRREWFRTDELRDLAVPAVYRRILEEYLTDL